MQAPMYRTTPKSAQVSCSRSGYTLLEIILVIVLLSTITTMVSLQFLDVIGRGQEAIATDLVGRVRYKLELYRVENGSYPTTMDSTWLGDNDLINPWKPEDQSVQVATHATRICPPQKRASGGLSPFWYNSANGSFIVRVDPDLSGSETLSLFNSVNNLSMPTMGSTQ